jgi:hypothetical protein
MTLIEKVARAMWSVSRPHPTDDELSLIWPCDEPLYCKEAKAAIAVVLRDMYNGRCIRLDGKEFTEQWRSTVLCYAKREGIELYE